MINGVMASRALSFAVEKRAFVSAKNKACTELSAVLLDGFRGGRIAISGNDYDEFLSRYAEDVEAGRRVCFVECKTALHPFFADLDLQVEQEIDSAARAQLIMHIVDAMRPFLRTSVPGRLDCLVATAPVKSKDGKIKCGIHITFPRLIVSEHEALLFRENIVAELKERYSHEFCTNGWDDAVDKSVYLGPGLRMIGSVKVVTCQGCTKHTSSDCGVCLGSGRVDEERKYQFDSFFSDGKLDAAKTALLHKCTAKVIKLASVRSFSDRVCPEFARFTGAPSYVEPTLRDPTKPPRMPTSSELAEDRRASRGWKRSRTVVTDRRVHEACERIVRNRVNRSRYEKLHVKEISTDTTKGFFDVKVSGQGSSFCMNKMDDHSSNTIYFHIERTGVTQRCFCRRPEVRRANVTCAKFRSAVHSISEDDVLTLFPAKSDESPDAKARRIQQGLKSCVLPDSAQCGEAPPDIGRRLVEMLEQEKGAR